MRLARIEHGLMTGIAAVAGFLAVKWCFCDNLWVVFVSSVLAEVSLFAFNDIFNLEEDRINSPDRPLVRGELTRKEALAFALASAAASIILAFQLGTYPLVVLFAAIVLGNLYNAYLKRLSILGNLTVAGLTATSFLYGSLSTGVAVPEKVVLFFIIAFLANVGREISKGIRDLEGDSKAGICTLACEVGVEEAGLIAAVFMSLAVVLSMAAVNYFTFKVLFISLISVTDVIFIHAAYQMITKPSHAAGWVRKTTLIGMLLALISFITP